MTLPRTWSLYLATGDAARGRKPYDWALMQDFA